MNKLILLLVAPLLASGQSVTDLRNLQNLLTGTLTVVLTVTASQGDGTVCRIAKVAGSSVMTYETCSSADGKTTLSPMLFQATGTAASSRLLSSGDVSCLLGANPTTTSVTMGVLGSIPATTLAWQCTANIRTGGNITGQTAPVSGSVSWP